MKNFRTENLIHFLIRRYFPRVNHNPLLVFGNQKSGTTAIAGLLALYCRLSVTLDIGTATADEQDGLHSKELGLKEFIHNHKFEFSAAIIKEPGLTLLYEDVKKYYNPSGSIFIVRDPRDNARSILNRVNADGKAKHIPHFNELPLLWQRIIDNRWLGLAYDYFIDSLAARWNLVVDVYLNHPGDFVLVRYEDFVENKIETIKSLANAFSLKGKADISSHVDRQFQPAGMKSVQWEEFFGKENLGRIEEICSDRMRKLNYEIYS